MCSPVRVCCLVALMLPAVTGCTAQLKTSLEHLMEGRRLAADLLVQFTKATDATNLSVMADTDEASAAFARQAAQATDTVQKDADALAPILTSLGYSNETRLLEEFGKRFAEYRALDRTILGLSVENTNLKAHRLSFGPAQDAADKFRDALAALAPANDRWRVEALKMTAVSAVRQIQVLQAPHIAEADDAAMTRIEKQMAASERVARSALETLAGLVAPASRSQLDAAGATLDRFVDLNAQIVMLSRRNSNVRSLALTLGQKRMLTAACEDSLRALQDALDKRGFSATR
jgi:hypothetical protein